MWRNAAVYNNSENCTHPTPAMPAAGPVIGQPQEPREEVYDLATALGIIDGHVPEPQYIPPPPEYSEVAKNLNPGPPPRYEPDQPAQPAMLTPSLNTQMPPIEELLHKAPPPYHSTLTNLQPCMSSTATHDLTEGKF